jgi:hypothetical protein
VDLDTAHAVSLGHVPELYHTSGHIRPSPTFARRG